MNKYELTTERKKKDVVNAALALFNEKGFTDTSIKEIAALAKVSQVSIYNYFGSKDALVPECAKLVVHDTLQRADEILKKDIDFKEKIQLALALCTEDINLAVSEYFSQKALDDPKMLEHLVNSLNRSKADIFRSYFEQGKKEGCIDTSIDTETILDFVEAINTAGSTMQIDESTSDKIRQIHHLFLYGLIGK